jgi:hypothetical protein
MNEGEKLLMSLLVYLELEDLMDGGTELLLAQLRRKMGITDLRWQELEAVILEDDV